MFSIPKLIILVLIVGAVWYGYKMFTRGRAVGAPKKPGNVAGDRTGAVDMAKCAVCGDFVPGATASDCGRTGCPYPPA
jgi:uncharacterized protein